MHRVKWFILGIALSVALPILASISTLGRLELQWPDFGEPNGPANAALIQGSIRSISDNVNTRIEEYSAVADSTTVVVTHNFGLDLENLNLVFYNGVGGSKVLGDINVSGFTAVVNAGDPKNKIDITTPTSGGPHDFSVVLGIGLGEPSGITFSENYTLFEDLSANTLVRLVDDGGVAKIEKSGDPAPPGPTNFNEVVGAPQSTSGRTDWAYNSAQDSYLLAEGNRLILIRYVGDVPTVLDTYVLPMESFEQPCVEFHESVGVYFVGHEFIGTMYVNSVDTSADTIVLGTQAAVVANSYASCGLAYSPTLGTMFMGVRGVGNNFSHTVIGWDGSKVFLHNPVTAESYVLTHIRVDSLGTNKFMITGEEGSVFTAARAQIVTNTSSILGKTNSASSLAPTTFVDSATGKVVATGINFNVDYRITVVEDTGGAPTIGPLVVVDATIVPPSFNFFPVLGYHADLGSYYVYYGNDSVAGYIDTFTYTGNTVTMGANKQQVVLNGSDSKTLYGPYFLTRGTVLSGIGTSTTGTKKYGFDISAGFTPNLSDAVGLLGVGGLAGSAGNVTLFGGKSDSFVGKDAGAKAYLQSDMTVSELPTSDPMGFFLSPTKLHLRRGVTP